VLVDIKQHKSQFKNSNFTITQSAKFFLNAVDQHEIWREISSAQMDFVGGPALQNYNSRWRRPPSWIFAQTAI